MDANESSLKYQSNIASWINRLHLVNVLTAYHGHEGQPPSIASGSDRIDYILLTRQIAPYTKSTGILPHNYVVDSDHRPLFIDIDIETFLKGIPFDNISHSSRGIKGDNPKAIKKYQRLVTQALDASRLEEELEKLTAFQQLHGFLTCPLKEQAKQIDRLITQIKHKAEDRCRHILNTPWSPKLFKLKSLSFFWKSWLREIRTYRSGSLFRQRICPDMPQLVQPSIDTIKTALRASQKAFKTALRDAANLRATYLQERAQLLSNTGRLSEEKILTQPRWKQH